MEKLKIKHDHKLTDILKVGIFCLFLILPILLFLPNCLYYGFNEHATNTETTTINYKYQSNEVNNVDDLVEGNIYIYDYLELDTTNNIYFHITFIKVSEVEDQVANNFLVDDFAVSLYKDEIDLEFSEDYIYFDVGSTTGYVDVYVDIFKSKMHDVILYFNDLPSQDFINQYGLPQYTDYNVIESVEVNTEASITTQICNAWGNLWQTPFLEWTDNNNFQFTINSFCNVFGITQESYITNYLTYILTMTCIYLVFDIVISISTKLTHMLTNSKD